MKPNSNMVLIENAELPLDVACMNDTIILMNLYSTATWVEALHYVHEVFPGGSQPIFLSKEFIMRIILINPSTHNSIYTLNQQYIVTLID